MFKNLMNEIGEPIPDSEIVSSYEDAKKFSDKIGFPIIIRPAFTLGGSGGGIAKNEAEYEEIVHSGLQQSPINQVLVEKSIAGFKEVEYEVMRDANDTCIIIVIWKTLTLSVFIRETALLWHLLRPLRTMNIRC